MLEHLGPRQRPFLGHVAQQEQRRAGRLHGLEQLGGAFPDLADGAGAAYEVGVVDGLDGVDHQDRGLQVAELLDDAGQVGLAHQIDVLRPGAQALGAGPHLRQGFLPGNVKDFLAGVSPRGQRRAGLQRQRALADAGRARQQHYLPVDQAAAQGPVQLRDAGGPVLGLQGARLGKFHRRLGKIGKAAGLGGRLGKNLFGLLHQGVPAAASVALPRPFRGGLAALLATVNGSEFHVLDATSSSSPGWRNPAGKRCPCPRRSAAWCNSRA